jgi:hypothetical protein
MAANALSLLQTSIAGRPKPMGLAGGHAFQHSNVIHSGALKRELAGPDARNSASDILSELACHSAREKDYAEAKAVDHEGPTGKSFQYAHQSPDCQKAEMEATTRPTASTAHAWESR